MIKCVLISHGQLAEALQSAAESICGKRGHVSIVAVEPETDLQTVEETLLKVVLKGLDEPQCSGCLILVDLLGGSPSQLTAQLLNEPRIQVVTGMNLPMLIGVLNQETTDLHALTGVAIEAGTKGIKDLKKAIGGTHGTTL